MSSFFPQEEAGEPYPGEVERKAEIASLKARLHQLEETSYTVIRTLQLRLNRLDSLIGRLSDDGKLDDTSYTALCDVIHRGARPILLGCSPTPDTMYAQAERIDHESKEQEAKGVQGV